MTGYIAFTTRVQELLGMQADGARVQPKNSGRRAAWKRIHSAGMDLIGKGLQFDPRARLAGAAPGSSSPRKYFPEAAFISGMAM
jgi:hypothetical protein